MNQDMQNKFKNEMDKVISQYNMKTAITYLKDDGFDEKILFEDIGKYFLSFSLILKKMGLIPTDRVAIIAPHSPWTVLTGMALAHSGITLVLIDASLPKEEIRNLLMFSEVKAIFTFESVYEQLHNEFPQIPWLQIGHDLSSLLFPNSKADCIDLPSTKYSDSDVIAILYSSGTTGQMKGIMVTYDSVLKARDIFVRLSGLKDYMTYLLVLPFNHIAGFTGAFTFFLTGCELGFIENTNASKIQNGLKRFQPHYFAMIPKVYEVIEHKVRHVIHEKGQVVEIVFNIMLQISKISRKYLGINIGRKMFKNITKSIFGDNIFGIGMGASPCKVETTEFFLNLGLELANLYATTETSVPITASGIEDQYPVGTVGNVNRNPEIQVKIRNVDENGIGEITVKSELMMKGYFKRSDLTAIAFDNGYFLTGDYGYIDRNGYLYITGRMKESIVLASGKKVSPSDVDDYYLFRTKGYDIASRGVTKSQEQYDEIHLFIADKAYSPLEKERIIALFQKLSGKAPDIYKLSQIHFLPELPRTSIGKIKRFCLEAKSEESGLATPQLEGNLSDKLLLLIQSYCPSHTVEIDSALVNDLGLDSLTMFQIICEIEEKFHVDLSQDLQAITTVKDIVLSMQNTASTENEYAKNEKNKKTVKRLKRWIHVINILYKIDIFGIENIPEDESYILCANHESYFDPLFLLTAMKDNIDLKLLRCMAAKHTAEGWLSNRLFNMLGGIPVDREGNTLPAMQCAKRSLEQGSVVIVFPEGARSRDGNMLPFKYGAAFLAIDTNKKILPVSIDGAYEIFPRWNKFPHFFNWRYFKKYSLQIRIGEAIVPTSLTEKELTVKIKKKIIDMKENSI